MGRCVRHTRCPKCAERGKDRKGNNLGVYEDGSQYCFSCGWRNNSVYATAFNFHHINDGGQNNKNVSAALPDDVDTVYPTNALRWVAQYGLALEDLYVHKCLWSNLYSRLIFPYYEDSSNTLLGWQGRYFGEEDKPKWFSRGNLDTIYHILNREQSRDLLVIVEDVVSAIKLEKAGVPVMPLFGSYISSKKLHNLSLLTNRLCVWLDPDKAKESVIFSEKANQLGLPCTVVHSSKDPKEMSYEYIREVYETKLGGQGV